MLTQLLPMGTFASAEATAIGGATTLEQADGKKYIIANTTMLGENCAAPNGDTISLMYETDKLVKIYISFDAVVWLIMYFIEE